MKIALGNDHAALGLKVTVVDFLKANGYEFEDFGAFERKEGLDYPDFAEMVARSVASGECELGILLCGTGIGVAIAANKVKGVRAATCNDIFTAGATRAHNDANILCMGERVIGAGTASEILKAFFGTQFEGGRHQRRVDKITAIEAAQE